MKAQFIYTVFFTIILICITFSFTSCPSPIAGGGGADVDMSNYYTKTEIDGLITWMKNGDNIYNKNTGSVGIGTTTPGANKLQVNGNLDASSITINGAPVSTSTDTYWSNNSGKISYSGGNVGIGTNNPSASLEVAGSVKIGAYTLPATDGTNGYVLKTNGSGVVSWETDNSGGGGGGGQWSDGTGGAIYYNGGNVGIGTSTPGKRLSIAGDAELGIGNGDYRHLRLGGGNSSGFLYGSFAHLADGIHMGYNYYADAAGANHVVNIGGSTSRISMGYGYVAIATGAVNTEPSNRFAVDTEGDVGIGTMSPTHKLETAGSFYLNNGSQGALLSETAGYLNIRTGSSALNIDNTGGTANLMTITSSGSVGIGTTNPTGRISNNKVIHITHSEPGVVLESVLSSTKWAVTAESFANKAHLSLSQGSQRIIYTDTAGNLFTEGKSRSGNAKAEATANDTFTTDSTSWTDIPSMSQ